MTDHLEHDLFLLMLSLSQIKSRERVVALFIEALNSLETGFFLRLLAEGESTESYVVDISTSAHNFGKIAIDGDISAAPLKMLPIIRNSVRMLAILLENIEHGEQLQYSNLRLEEMLRDRTSVLLSNQATTLRIYQAISSGVLLQDARGIIVHVNQAACNILGLPAEELIGRSVYDSPWQVIKEDGSPISADDHPTMVAVRTRKPVLDAVIGVFCPDIQSYRWILVDAQPIEDRFDANIEVIATFIDITERKKAEKLINALATHQAAIAMLGQRALAGTDLNTLMDEATTLVAQALDADYAEVLETVPNQGSMILRSTAGWEDSYLGQEITSLPTGSQAGYTLNQQKPVIVENLSEDKRFESELLSRLGVVSGASVVIRGQHSPFGALGVHTKEYRKFSQDDIYFLQTVASVLSMAVERNQAEADLRKKSSAINAAGDQIYITDINGIIEFVNPAFVRETGYSEAEVIGKSYEIFEPEEHDASVHPEIWETILSGKVWHGEVVHKCKDGSLRTVDMTITPVKNDAGEIERFISIKRDVTEKRMFEEQFQQSRKMEMIGKLAAGIAHDFNNLLQAILGYSRVLMEHDSIDHSAKQDLHEIERASLRAADLVRQVLTFSRQVPGRKKPMEVRWIAQEAVRLVKNTFPRKIVITCELSDDCKPVLADESQIHQVIMNLCLNSRDAMKDGGNLNIKVDQLYLDDAFVSANPWAHAGDFVRCTVSDTGIGMDKKTLERAVEPFFTTKSPQEGTGLGLSTCYGIVLGHDGCLNIESKPGCGTVVSVYFPAAEGCLSEVARVKSDSSTFGTETILLVDDEDYIQRLTSRVLENFGYKVVISNNGREALEYLCEHGDEIALILLDINMPEMDGIQALSAIRKLSPSAKVLISTGLDVGLDKLPEHELPDGILQKPYKPELLLRAIRDILDSSN